MGGAGDEACQRGARDCARGRSGLRWQLIFVMRLLVLSLGNTSLFGGVFAGARLVRTFRLPAAELVRLPGRAGTRIDAAVLCSVVPALTPDVVRLIRRTWGVEPERLTAAAAHGLKIGYRRPRELGADRVAAALGARELFPRRNVIVVDCGTATTVTALRRDGTVLGGAILPGLSLWPEMLAARTAQLPRVAPVRPRRALGRAPAEGIASGVYFGQVGAIREVVARVRAEAFGRAAAVVVGTGGHARRLEDEKLFAVVAPTLILSGLQAYSVRISFHATSVSSRQDPPRRHHIG